MTNRTYAQLEEENKIFRDALHKIQLLDHTDKECLDHYGELDHMDLTHAEDLEHLETAIRLAGNAISKGLGLYPPVLIAFEDKLPEAAE